MSAFGRFAGRLIIGCLLAACGTSPIATVPATPVEPSPTATLAPSTPAVTPSPTPLTTPSEAPTLTPAATPTVTPAATPTTPAETTPPAGSVEEAEPYCALVDAAAVEQVLGAPIGDDVVERNRAGGAWCNYAAGDFDTDPGQSMLISIDRTSNLARWMPDAGWDAQHQYDSHRAAFDRRPQDIPDLGVAATWDGRHEMLVLLEPDVLLWISFTEAELEALVNLVRAIESRVAAGLPAQTNQPLACRLLGYADVESITGRDINIIQESAEFTPATTCEFSGPVPGFFVDLDLARIVLFRTDDIRSWLALPGAADFVPLEIVDQAATYTAQQWLTDLGLYGAAFLLDGESPGPKGPPIDVDGACAAFWFPGDDERVYEPRFEAAYGRDDYMVLLLDWDDDVDVARQLAAIVLERLTAERGGALSPCL